MGTRYVDPFERAAPAGQGSNDEGDDDPDDDTERHGLDEIADILGLTDRPESDRSPQRSR